MGNKNNMNKYFALILTFVIVGGLLVNPIFSDISIILSHFGGTLPGTGNYSVCTDNITLNAVVNITTDCVTNVTLTISNSSGTFMECVLPLDGDLMSGNSATVSYYNCNGKNISVSVTRIGFRDNYSYGYGYGYTNGTEIMDMVMDMVLFVLVEY